MDLSKLTPAPWHATDELYDNLWGVSGGGWLHVGVSHHPDSLYKDDAHAREGADAEFIALARNAFDVQMRRGWWVVPYLGKPNEKRWFVRGSGLTNEIQDSEHTDPFTALVEADKWYTKNVENKKETDND